MRTGGWEAGWSSPPARSRPPASPFFTSPERHDDEAALLPSLVTGTPFAQMCEDLVARLGMEDGITRAGALLARWTQAGLLTRQP